VLDPILVPTTHSNTSTLDLFPDADRCDEDLQSAQLSPAVGEISPLDFDIDVHQDSDKPVFTAQGTPPGMRMITQLRAAILQLPEAVALATPADELARFSGDPAEESLSYDDPWEMVDQALNAVVGYGYLWVTLRGSRENHSINQQYCDFALIPSLSLCLRIGSKASAVSQNTTNQQIVPTSIWMQQMNLFLSWLSKTQR
jgi:hypothetical protein